MMNKPPTAVKYVAGGALAASLLLNATLLLQLSDREKSPAAPPPPPVRSTPAPDRKKTETNIAPQSRRPARLFVASCDSGEGRLFCYFDGQIDSDRPEEKITLVPEQPFRVGIDSSISGPHVVIEAKFTPGEFYTVIFSPELVAPGIAGAEPLKYSFFADDLTPQLRFASRGSFFPLYSSIRELPLETVNTEKVEAELFEVYPNRLIDFLQDQQDNYLRKLKALTLPAAADRNQRTLVALSFDSLGIPRRPGVYFIKVRDRRSWPRDSRIVTVTDLAIQAAAGNDAVAFALRSLRQDLPVAGAEVELYSRKFQRLGGAVTDDSGFGKIAILPSGDRDDHPALLLAKKGEDVTYFMLNSLESPEARQSGRAVPASPADGYQACLFPERGICRPGESIEIFGYLREAGTLRAAGGVPLELAVTTPSGRALPVRKLTGDRLGFYRDRLELAAGSETGAYRAVLRAPDGKVFGRAEFQVAEYVPDRIRVTLKPESETVPPGEALRFSGRLDYYFGAPVAAGKLRYTASARKARFAPARWPKFRFGLDEKGSALAEHSAAGRFAMPDQSREGVSGNDGLFSGEFTFPAPEKVPELPVEFTVTASAQPADGGRTVSNTVRTTTHYRDRYYGLADGGGSGGTRREFLLAAVTPDERPAEPAAPHYELFRREWNCLLRRNPDGVYSYEWQELQIPAGSGSPGLSRGENGVHRFALDLPGAGFHTLFLYDEHGTAVASTSFWHGAGESGERSRNPSLLAFELDRPVSRPGESTAVEFDSPGDGRAVIFCGGDTFDSTRSIPVKAGRNRFELPVPAQVATGSYFAGVTVVIPPADDAKAPRRLFGLVRLDLDQSRRRLELELDAPRVSRPGETIRFRAKVRDHEGKPAAAAIQFWAVDSGILALTDWRTPDPGAHFFGPAESPFRFGDGYADLYPLLKLDRGKIGGDQPPAALYRLPYAANRKTPAVVALREGTVDASGEGVFELPLPGHTGALRLMAIALDAERTGSAECELTLRDPISLELTLPRAVAPGDEFELLMTGFNHESETAEATWSVETGGALELPETASGALRLDKGKPAAVKLRLRAGKTPGEAKILVTLRRGGETVRQEESFTVRPEFPAVDRLRLLTVEPGGAADLTAEDPALVLLTAPVRVEAGTPFPALSGALGWLNCYPYGCLEQTVAAAFPLLAVKPLVRAGVIPEPFAEQSDERIRAAIGRIGTTRLSNGFCSMWPGERDSWTPGTLFAWHFLLEADRNGCPLPAGERSRISDHLRELFADRDRPDEERAYIAYLFALADPVRGDLCARNLPDKEAAPFVRFLTGAALMQGGRAAEGMKIIDPLLAEPFWRLTGNGGSAAALDSEVRRIGLALWILGEFLPERPELSILAAELQKRTRPDGQWGDTNRNAWAALGLARLAERRGAGEFRGVCRKPDGTEVEFTNRAFEAAFPPGAKFRVENRGGTPLAVFLRSRGIPERLENSSSGFTIRREYLDRDGKPVTECAAGELLRVRLTVTAEQNAEHIVICDLLPGGLEIEDDRLASRSAVFHKRTSSDAISPRTIEKRDDRFLLFGDIRRGQSLVEYQVRAVTRGDFTIPAVRVEAMYRPELQATEAGTGRFRVR